MGEPIGRELSTLSTAPTVRTTVETDDKSRDSPAPGGLGKIEGPGGKEPSGPLEPGWARALASRASCALGHCAYANPDGRPNRSVGANGCDGYHATRSTESDGRVIMRWGLCPRHVEWWRRERIREQSRKRGAMLKSGPHPGLGPER
jgi:hypothetical protein